MQNDCRDDETSIIKLSYIKYFNGAIPKDEKIVWYRLGVDPAIGEKQTNDDTGMVLCAKTDHGNYYILDVKGAKNTLHKTIQSIGRYHDLYGVDLVVLEAIAAFKGMAQEIRRTTNVPLKEIKSVPDKVTRLTNQQAKFENGYIHISMDIEERIRETLVEQLINNTPAHDDLRDALMCVLESDDKGRVTIGFG
jgi:predicted phage terminase large subunit-like protein